MIRLLKNILQNQGKTLSTDFKRKFKSSGQLFLKNTVAISTNEIFVFQLDQRFIPYDDVNLVNLSTKSNALITINNNHVSSLPRGNSIILNNRNVTDIRVTNIGVTDIAINEIQLFYEHTGAEGQSIINKASNVLSTASAITILRRA